MTPITLTAPDGQPLAARLYGQPGTARSAVLIGAAMGVPMAYYADFAAWLAGQGHVVLTFDYRGCGGSRPGGSLAHLRADLIDWARDTDTALLALATRAPARPIYLVGHSLGAQLPGLLAHRERLAGLVCVAAGSGHWHHNPRPLRHWMPAFWYALMPLVTSLCGYFPGRRLRLVGDLPRGVAWQWRRWCLDPDYHLGAETPALRTAFADLRMPVTALSIADDEMMSEEGTRALLDWYSGAPRRHERVQPTPGERIGHLGFFRRRFEATHWPRITRALAEFDPA